MNSAVLFEDDFSVRVNKTLSPEDGMYLGDVNHYFACGESALRVLLAAISLAGTEPPRNILDFGAGAGRVTRWLMAAFPDARIHACDVRTRDVDFLRSSLGVDALVVGTDIDLLSIPGKYDLIWAGSVVTHLPASETRRLIDRLLASCNAGGLLAFSFHGQHTIESGGGSYIHEDGWQLIRSGYFAHGYGYADYQGQPGYGISACTTSWMNSLINSMLGVRMVLLSERAWDNHHDVAVIQKHASSPL